jgi:hypothetical protein
LQRWLRLTVIALSAPPSQVDSGILKNAREELEKFMLGQPEKVGKSELRQYFDDAEREDEKNQKKRDEWIRIGKRTKKLRTTWALYKGALINGGAPDLRPVLLR